MSYEESETLKIIYTHQHDFNEFNNLYLPLMVRQGLSLRLFPRLGIYINTPIPGVVESDLTAQPNSEFALHFPTDEFDVRVHTHIITLEQVLDIGGSKEFFEMARKMLPSALPHEVGHYIHMMFFGQDGSDIWKKAWSLMSNAPLDFSYKTSSTGHRGKIAWEAFAEEIHDIIEGRKVNLPLMQYIWELIDLHTLVFKVGSKEYTHNGVKKTMDVALPVIYGRSFVPLRTIVEELKDIKLRDVFYDDKTKEVVVIGGNNDEVWGE